MLMCVAFTVTINRVFFVIVSYGYVLCMLCMRCICVVYLLCMYCVCVVYVVWYTYVCSIVLCK